MYSLEQNFRFEVPRNAIVCVAFSRDGTLVIAGGVKGFVLWNIIRQEEVHFVKATCTRPMISFNNDGSRFCAMMNRDVCIFDLSSTTSDCWLTLPDSELCMFGGARNVVLL